MKETVIIGGGLSGLITAIQLANAGMPVTLFEKKTYPFHRVCGEYISNETVPFLKRLNIYPEQFTPATINQLQLTSVNGKAAVLSLHSGGFGVSRYSYDRFLFEKASSCGVTFFLDEEVLKVNFHEEKFYIQTNRRELTADLVIGSFGKRSKIDVVLKRSFLQKRSPYIGVKYHIITEHPANRISLHNFKEGYCGISNIEGGKTNLCYLTHRKNVKKYGNIPELEKNVLYKNPFLKSIFENSDFLFERPETINEISFETKLPVEEHIFMTGDASGMITPLCGNGMAIAIHSSKILSELIIQTLNKKNFDRNELEYSYSTAWRKLFKNRLWVGRQIQSLFGGEWVSNTAVNIALNAKPVANWLVRQTHGSAF